jgi:hypothetical protein
LLGDLVERSLLEAALRRPLSVFEHTRR